MPIWGTAQAGEIITVEFAGQKKTATAGKDGKWRLELDAMPASAEPRNLVIHSSAGNRPLTIADVLVGDVWFIAGQSNAAMSLNDCDGGKAAAQEAESASSDASQLQPGSLDTFRVASALAGSFSAVGYWFGMILHKALNVPIGLVCRARAVGPPRCSSGRGPDCRSRVGPFGVGFVCRDTGPLMRTEKVWETTPPMRGPPGRGTARARKDNRWPADFWNAAMTGCRSVRNQGRGLVSGRVRLVGFRGGRALPAHDDCLDQRLAPAVGRRRLPVHGRSIAERPGQTTIPSRRSRVRARTSRRPRRCLAKSLPNIAYAVQVDSGESDIHPKHKTPLCERLAKAALASVYGRKSRAPVRSIGR